MLLADCADVLVNFSDHVVLGFFDFVLGGGGSSAPRAADVNAASENAWIAIPSGLRRLSKFKVKIKIIKQLFF